ncbi:hypothetical protein B296_00055547, partial [Ensete ventricosum]
IATVTGYPYLNPLSSLLLTIPLHLTTLSVVLAARRAPAAEGCRHCPPYLVNLGTNPGDLAKKVNSGTNPGDLAENVNSGTSLGDLVERMNSGTNHGDLAEKVNSGTNPVDLAENVNSCTSPGDLAERKNSGINPRDLVGRVNSGTNPGDLAERVNLSTNPGDLAEKVNSGTNPVDLAEKVNSCTSPGDLAERMNSGTNHRDLAERMNSGTNPGDLAERVNSGTSPGDLAKKLNSTTNPGDLAKRVNFDTNPEDLAERVNSGTNLGDLAKKLNSTTNPWDLAEKIKMTSSDSSGSVRVISSPGSGGVSQGYPEASSSGASSGPPSLVDTRVLRDMEVMKADHDLNTAVTEGSLVVIRGRYNISTEYRLHVSWPGQRPYSSDAPDMCISVDALEVGLRFPLHPLLEECLRWWRISPSYVAPNSWRYLVVFLGECREVEIIPTRDLFMTCFRLCKSRGSYYLTTRVDFQVSGAPSNNRGWKSRYLFVSGPVMGFRLDWSTHPIDNAPPYLSEEEFILVGRLKGILSSSCAIKEMTELWLVKVSLSPASSDQIDLSDLRGMPKMSSGKAPSTHVVAPAREVDVSPAREAPKASSKRSIDAPTEQVDDSARWHKKVKVWRSSTESMTRAGFITFMEYRISHLQQELDALKSGGGPEAVPKAEERASELEQELEKTKWERDKALQRLEASEKELSEVRSNPAEIQRLLKEARVRARKMDDKLLQAMKTLENARAELPKQAVDRYKESTGFKEGLKRMGRVTYEYGYRVALARFQTLHPDSEVEEDPFTIHPEDDLVPMERQQAFDDSDQLES